MAEVTTASMHDARDVLFFHIWTVPATGMGPQDVLRQHVGNRSAARCRFVDVAL
jgi:hypothetical protein